MTLTSRSVALASTGALTLTLVACADTGADTGGSDYPSAPIEIIVGYDAGGSTDTGARLIATELEDRLDATVTVVNKPGANSQIAYTDLTQASADGYTMGAVTFPSAIITVLDESRGATYDKDSFAPVALQVIDPTAIAVAPDSDINSPEDLVAAAEAAPGDLRATTTGVASNEHFALARLQEVTGVEIAPVHFADGGAAASTAFLGGNVELLVANVSDLQPLVDAGDAKVVGVMAEEPSPFLPDAPTFADAGYDVQISSSRGFAFPADTPEDVVTTVSDAIGDIMADEEFQEQMESQGLAPSYMGSEEYAEYWDETDALFSELLPLVREEQ